MSIVTSLDQINNLINDAKKYNYYLDVSDAVISGSRILPIKKVRTPKQFVAEDWRLTSYDKSALENFIQKIAPYAGEQTVQSCINLESIQNDLLTIVKVPSDTIDVAILESGILLALNDENLLVYDVYDTDENKAITLIRSIPLSDKYDKIFYSSNDEIILANLYKITIIEAKDLTEKISFDIINVTDYFQQSLHNQDPIQDYYYVGGILDDKFKIVLLIYSRVRTNVLYFTIVNKNGTQNPNSNGQFVTESIIPLRSTGNITYNSHGEGLRVIRGGVFIENNRGRIELVSPNTIRDDSYIYLAVDKCDNIITIGKYELKLRIFSPDGNTLLLEKQLGLDTEDIATVDLDTDVIVGIGIINNNRLLIVYQNVPE